MRLLLWAWLSECASLAGRAREQGMAVTVIMLRRARLVGSVCRDQMVVRICNYCLKVHAVFDLHRWHRLQGSSIVPLFVFSFVCDFNSDLLAGSLHLCLVLLRMLTRYAGCYPMQEFAGMSPSEKNDWEHVYVLQFFD